MLKQMELEIAKRRNGNCKDVAAWLEWGQAWQSQEKQLR